MSLKKRILHLIIPLPEIDSCDNYVFVAPHPDDAEVGAGATMAKLAEKGKRITLIIATDGRYGSESAEYMFHMPQAFGTLDTVATFSKIENVYWAMKHVVEENFPEATFIGHFSHWYDWGCMLYARFIFEKAPDDPAEAAALYNRVWDLAIRAAIREGGVINEHHGVGLKLGRLMKELYGPAMGVLEDIKKQLDPNNIMNPGKMGFKGV